MRVEAYDNEPERSILISLIVSPEVLAKVTPKAAKSLFRSDWSDLIASWCTAYYLKYKKAPGAAIEKLFAKWCETSQNEDTKKTINRLLSSLSAQYESLASDIDPAFAIDQATDYFNRVLVEKHIEDLKTDMERGHFEAATLRSESFKRLQLATPAYIDLIRDKEAQRLAMERKQSVLIKYKGGLSEFFGDELSEESLVVLVASMKQGKSYYMLDMAWKAMLQGKRVAYFQVGDLSQDQIIRRFQCRAAYKPLKRRVVNYPLSITPAQHSMAHVDFKSIPFDHDLSAEAGQKAFEKIAKSQSKELFRLSCHATKSVSVLDIETILDSWDRDNWHAQVVVVDYSENLSPVNTKMLPLDQVEETWAILSRLRERRRCLVVTAIQAPREGFNAWVLTRRHFSKNKMIFAHATAVIGLNRTDEEIGNSVMRLNWVVRREDIFQETKCCFVAECRDLCHVSVVSHF